MLVLSRRWGSAPACRSSGAKGGIEADLAEDAQPHPVFVRLSAALQRFKPIDDLQKLKAERVRAVLLAQPRALRPAELAAFDSWIRDGGRALVLADPALQSGEPLSAR